MSSIAEQIVDDIVTRLGAASFTTSVTPGKRLFQRSEREALSDPIASVSVGPEQWEKSDRSGTFLKTYEVEVVVAAACSDSQVGTYMELAEEIKEDLATRKMASLPLVGIEQEEPYDEDRLHQSGQFSARITFIYRGF